MSGSLLQHQCDIQFKNELTDFINQWVKETSKLMRAYKELATKPNNENLIFIANQLLYLDYQAIYNLLQKVGHMSKQVIQIQQPSMVRAYPSDIQNQQKNHSILVKFFQLFRFAKREDFILIGLGTFSACIMGTAIPLLIIVWGNFIDSFGNKDKMVDETRDAIFKVLVIAAGTLLAGWGMFGCWIVAAERQGVACRQQYLRSLLRQEMGWFDTINQLELASKFVNDTSAFQGAIGEKVSSIVMTISTLITSLVIAFIKGWLMALVTLASIPVVILGAYVYSYAVSKKDSEIQNEYSLAGGLAEQAISAIKTVKQLNGEQFEADRYLKTLTKATNSAKKYGVYIGVGIGSMYCTIFSAYGLAFWFGSNCVQDNSVCPSSLNDGHPYSAGDVLTILFCILQVGFNFLQFTPAIKKISEGRTAAARIFKIIDRAPLIVSPPNAIKPQEFKGVFSFENVTFAYPKDPSHPIISNLSLKINSKSAAFVGDSGCGKSTLFQLMMRFYDPDQGRITLDGYDLRELDLEWLRRQIGYVGQEPFLFSGTIRENLLLGKEDATQKEINDALRKAEAYDFVYQLKDKLETHMGTGGSQVSGGQKQRLAIARALLKNPKILLLDEATSALDRHNEKNIQKTLNKIASEKWTVTIAHNVRTIMNCEEIFVVSKGSLEQAGTFRELRSFKDFYQAQMEVEQSKIEVQAYIVEQNKENGLKIETKTSILERNEATIPSGQGLNEEAIKARQEQELIQKYESSVFGRLFSYSTHRKGLFFFGILVSILNGTIFPGIGVLLARILSTLIFFSDDPEQSRKDSNLFSLLFVILGVAYLVLCIIQQAIFSTIGEEVTEKVRSQIYHKILRMPISWFQLRPNNSSLLSSRLASECKSINGLTTTYIAIIVQSISNLLTGVTISLIFQWRTGLVAIGMIPLIIIAGAVQIAVGGDFNAQTEKYYKESSSLITESMLNIRTIHSLAHEGIILQKYSEKLKVPIEKSTWKGNISGILFGFSQCIMYVTFAIVLYLGAIFIRDNNLKVADAITAAYSILFVGLNIGNSAHFMPDINAAKLAAANLFSILDDEDEDQLQIKAQSKLLKTSIKGNIEFRNVDFKYQTRKEEVFKGLSFEIKEGTKVGFVGASGCGKSTIHQLLQRFYDPRGGQILIDGVDIADYDIHHLRASLGFVNQEPTLFNDTIANNIKYNCKEATHEEVLQAANDSHFNPDIQQVNEEKEGADVRRGFDKKVGVKGSHVSGGQKQRLAIARMLLRRPKVLLLDEATSALDSTNERKVQASLDCLMRGKTSIVIAHRIDTVKNSDAIFLFDGGNIVEKGTYEQLMRNKGLFYELEKEKGNN